MFQLIVVNQLLLVVSSLIFNLVNCSNQTEDNSTITASPTCNCGQFDLIDTNYWPWLVRIRSQFASKNLNCFGVLISSFNILTAGHCVYSSKYGLSDQVIVYLPTSQFNWIQLKVSKYIYDSRSNGTSHNIALITLINPVPTNYKPICLTITEDVPSAIVIGFNHDKNTTKSLVQQSNVEYINLEKCENERLSWINKLPQLPVNQRLKFTGYNKIDSSMLCANDTINDKFDINHTNRLNLVKSNCKHNSGEPLISKSNDRWFLVGIVSGTWFNHDYNDCLTLLPTIYTGIWYYAEWINYNCIDCCLIETN